MHTLPSGEHKVLALKTLSFGVGAFFFGLFQGSGKWANSGKSKEVCKHPLCGLARKWARIGREVRKSCNESQIKRMEEL